MKRKQVCSLLLAFLLVLTLLPMPQDTVYADMWPAFYLQGQKMDLLDIEGPIPNPYGEGTYEYKKDTNTLILTDFTLDYKGTGYALAFEALNVDFIGNNRIRSEGKGVRIVTPPTISYVGMLIQGKNNANLAIESKHHAFMIRPTCRSALQIHNLPITIRSQEEGFYVAYHANFTGTTSLDVEAKFEAIKVIYGVTIRFQQKGPVVLKSIGARTTISIITPSAKIVFDTCGPVTLTTNDPQEVLIYQHSSEGPQFIARYAVDKNYRPIDWIETETGARYFAYLGQTMHVVPEEQVVFPNLTVSYNTGGGSAIPDQTVKYGQRALQPVDPAHENYLYFAGWCIDKALTTAFDFNTPITKDTTLYAKWGPKAYYLTYDANNGTGTRYKDGPYEYGEQIVLYLPPVEGFHPPAGKTLSHFLVDGKRYENYEAYKVGGNPTVIVYWKDYVPGANADMDRIWLWIDGVKIPLQPEFHSSVLEYTGVIPATGTKLTGQESLKEPGGTLERKLNGSATGITQDELYTTKYPALHAGTNVLTFDTTSEDGSNQKTYTVTLYREGSEPQEPVEYIVSFDSNGGSPTFASQTVQACAKAKPPFALPVYAGHEFQYWYDKDKAEQAFDFNTPITGNITLCAKWIAEDTPSDPDAPGITTRRVFGQNRMETAIALSKDTFTKADTVILARADDYPDALTASVLAKAKDGPILLTYGDRVHAQVQEELNRLGAKNLIVIGGTAAIDDATAQAYAKDRTLTRIGGENRYDTAGLVADEVTKLVGKKGTAMITTGENYPDAIAISADASRLGVPILLVRKAGVPEETRAALTRNNITKTTVIGGEAVIPQAVAKSLPKAELRLGGKNRYETAARIAKHFHNTANTAYLATGEDFPDALTAGLIAGRANAPLLLTKAELLRAETATYLKEAGVKTVIVVGGPNAIGEAVVNEMK